MPISRASIRVNGFSPAGDGGMSGAAVISILSGKSEKPAASMPVTNEKVRATITVLAMGRMTATRPLETPGERVVSGRSFAKALSGWFWPLGKGGRDNRGDIDWRAANQVRSASSVGAIERKELWVEQILDRSIQLPGMVIVRPQSSGH